MKITDVRTVLLSGPSTNDPFLREARKTRSAAFIEVHTDTELVGIGETYAGYFCPEVVPGVVEFFKPVLLGQNADSIDILWKRMYNCGNFWCRVGLGAAVLAGVEAALWDLRGKLTGLPVHQLLGGPKHEKLLCYATGGPSNYPKDRLAAKMDFYLSLGFRAFKLGAGSWSVQGREWFNSPRQAADFEADKMEFVRSRVGKDIRVMLDGHMGNRVFQEAWDFQAAHTVMKALEPYDLFFFEEPLPYTDPWGYSELCRSTSVPIAGGECLTGTCEWRVFVERDAFDIGQPDASFSGGLLEFMRAAAMLEGRGRKIATHSWGAAGSLMQNVHCGFACANTAILEVAPAYGGLHGDLLDGSFVMQEGMVLPPQKPGLGIVLTEEIKKRYPFLPGSGEFNSVPGKILRE